MTPEALAVWKRILGKQNPVEPLPAKLAELARKLDRMNARER